MSETQLLSSRKLCLCYQILTVTGAIGIISVEKNDYLSTNKADE